MNAPTTDPIDTMPGGEVRWVEDAQGRMRPFPTPWRPNDWTPDESPSP